MNIESVGPFKTPEEDADQAWADAQKAVLDGALDSGDLEASFLSTPDEEGSR